jgi:lactate permease
VLGATSISGITKELDEATSAFSWPGLHVLNAKGNAPSSETFKLNYLTAAGARLFVSGVITAFVLRVRPALAVRTYWDTIGWFGTAVSGSDTSTNSLFGALQVAAAHKANLSATLLAGANSSGGVLMGVLVLLQSGALSLMVP